MRSTKELSGENIIALMYFTEGSTEAARYLLAQVKANFKLNGVLEKNKDLLLEMEGFCKNVELHDTITVDVWAGEPVPDKKENIYLQKAQELAKNMPDDAGAVNVEVEFVIGEDTSFNRNYSQGGQPLESSVREEMDSYIHAWLLNNDLARSDGIIYALNDDATEYNKVISPRELEQMIKDPTSGYQQYVEDNSKKKLLITSLDVNSSVQLEKGSDRSSSGSGSSSS